MLKVGESLASQISQIVRLCLHRIDPFVPAIPGHVLVTADHVLVEARQESKVSARDGAELVEDRSIMLCLEEQTRPGVASVRVRLPEYLEKRLRVMLPSRHVAVSTSTAD